MFPIVRFFCCLLEAEINSHKTRTIDEKSEETARCALGRLFVCFSIQYFMTFIGIKNNV